MLQTQPLTSSSRRKRFGPKSRVQRAKLAHAVSRDKDPETVERLRAELHVVQAVEAYEGASQELQEAVQAAPAVDYDRLVESWPELSPEVKDRLRAVLS